MIDLPTLCRVLCFKRRFRRWNATAIHDWQTRRARKLATWAATTLPYYRDLWRGHDPTDVWNLPTTNKQAQMVNIAGATPLGATWDELIRFREEIDATRDYDWLYRGEYNVELSSGTSGAKGIHIYSRAERVVYRAMIAARNGIPASVYPLRVVLIMRVDSPGLKAINARGISLGHLNLSTPIADMVRSLNDSFPNVLAGQPWVLRELAREQAAGRLRLRLGALVPVAEVLEPDVREEIAAIFAAPIRELYQASEGLIASSCTEGRLHINEDFVAVQLGSGGAVEPHQPTQRMVVTNLYRRAQPILRYELNDMIELDTGPCPCGSAFRVIRRIHGRADDLLYGRDSAGQPRPIFPDYFLRFIIRASEGVEEYQVVQTGAIHFHVRLQFKTGADEKATEAAVRANLARMFEEHGCVPPQFEFAFGPPELHGEGRKLRRVIRACPAPESA